MNKFTFFIFFIITMLVTGCSVQRNTPFIDSEETIQLKYNMKKKDVLKKIGQPLYVEMGEQNSQVVIWVYEVRTIKVVSDKDPVDGTIIPNKIHKNTRPDKPIHRLRLEFIDDKLKSWGPMGTAKPEKKEEETTSKEEEKKDDKADAKKNKKQNKKKSKTLFIHPKIMISNSTYDAYGETVTWTSSESCCDYGWYGECYWWCEDWNSNWDYVSEEDNFVGMSIGANIGYGNDVSRWGIDFRIGNGFGAMLTYEKLNLLGLNWSIGFGTDVVSKDTDYGTYEGEGFMKLGIFKDMALASFPVSIGLEMIAHVDGNYNYQGGGYHEDTSSIEFQPLGPTTMLTLKYRMR